ncbi:MAG: ribose-phosphate pyrophosphokinase [Clostridiales bacterium]|nr:ribose-phosphate pyrophosphokinase [Clostridiales bacterium]
MPNDERILKTTPVGSLGLITTDSCLELGRKVDSYLVQWRENREHQHQNESAFQDYYRDSYLIRPYTPRFGTGEAKCVIRQSVRGYDAFLMVDVTNYSLTYSVCGHENHMSPDDHFADLKRVIAAIGGKARRITVIMPFLYESRQHRRTARESLDCPLALQELVNMGVENIITFDAHDPRVVNAIPLKGFENVMPSYQFIKGILANVPDLTIDSDHLMIVSPDEGATTRAIFLANTLSVQLGMFYKRRDFSTIVNGHNPIIAHEFLGANVEGKDIFIIDDMISSGDSMLDTARELKRRNARRIFVVATFGLFTNGLEAFDQAYEDGLIYRVVTTNLIYQTPELLSREYYIGCDMSKYIAYIIDTLNHDCSISDLLNPYDRIQNRVRQYKEQQKHDQMNIWDYM